MTPFTHFCLPSPTFPSGNSHTVICVNEFVCFVCSFVAFFFWNSFNVKNLHWTQQFVGGNKQTYQHKTCDLMWSELGEKWVGGVQLQSILLAQYRVVNAPHLDINWLSSFICFPGARCCRHSPQVAPGPVRRGHVPLSAFFGAAAVRRAELEPAARAQEGRAPRQAQCRCAVLDPHLSPFGACLSPSTVPASPWGICHPRWSIVSATSSFFESISASRIQWQGRSTPRRYYLAAQAVPTLLHIASQPLPLLCRLALQGPSRTSL